MQKGLSRSSVALLKRKVSYLKNDCDSVFWIMQKRLSRGSVALYKELCDISRMIETWGFGLCKSVLWIMQKRLSRGSVALYKEL